MPLINIDPNYNPSVRVRQRREGENIKRYRYPILARESVEIVVYPDQSQKILRPNLSWVGFGIDLQKVIQPK